MEIVRRANAALNAHGVDGLFSLLHADYEFVDAEEGSRSPKARDTAWALSQENIWHLNISYIGTGEDGERANDIIITARKRGRPVYGEGPWWNVACENVETREAAVSALSIDLDEIDPSWRDVLEIR